MPITLSSMHSFLVYLALSNFAEYFTKLILIFVLYLFVILVFDSDYFYIHIKSSTSSFYFPLHVTKSCPLLLRLFFQIFLSSKQIRTTFNLFLSSSSSFCPHPLSKHIYCILIYLLFVLNTQISFSIRHYSIIILQVFIFILHL